ncbi:hypothetical protein H5410_004328 [Solanum commersonii]|uniref:Uncharacterized protein n=1 Tax=Solanum commersonii TaxID=4109 RepID=A0A9J6B7P0_SOLCO|nr:hypothetical protein H5410_004328 [Solanum commersonii]
MLEQLRVENVKRLLKSFHSLGKPYTRKREILSLRSLNTATVEDFPLTIPQPSRNYASNTHFEDFDLEVEDDIL